MTTANLPVVAGVDGTSDGIAAAEYAAEFAARTSQPLMLLHAYRRSPAINPLLPVGDPITARHATTAVAYQPYVAAYNSELMRDAGAAALEAAHHVVEQRFPHLVIHEKLVSGSAAKALIKMSRTAAAVVVARNHERSIERFFVGSTSSAVSAHAACPVMVVPTNWKDLPKAGRIVVGLHAARDEAAVLDFAFREASLSGSDLAVLHAFEPPVTWLDRQGLSITGPDQAQDEERLLSEALAGWAERFPDVKVSASVLTSSAARALIQASDTADLIVVGARGQGGLRVMSMGSTARAVVVHATCPCVVVRHGERHARSRALTEPYPKTAFY